MTWLGTPEQAHRESCDTGRPKLRLHSPLLMYGINPQTFALQLGPKQVLRIRTAAPPRARDRSERFAA